VRLLAIIAAVVIVGAVLALVAFAWYPTTLEPAVTLTHTPFVATRCAPILLGGYANEFNTTLTLVNSGRADADTSVQFLLGNFSLGYRYYTVPQGSRVTDNASIIWEVHTSPTDCGPLSTPGPPAVALASVSRSPPLNGAAMVQGLDYPLAVLAFAAIMLGVLSLIARRRGFSMAHDLGSTGWVVGFLTAIAAIVFGYAVQAVLLSTYNYPPDWIPALIGGMLYGAVGVVIFVLACREMIRVGTRHQLNAAPRRWA
jgi:hypothetical protein